jgi:hypothetical protein
MPFAWVEWSARYAELLPRIFIPSAVTVIRRWSCVTGAVVLITLTTLLSMRAHAEIVHFYPLFNPAWDRMMTKVRTQTPEDAIVTGWWSPGHFLTSVGKRRVTIDGSSQETPQAYWVANLFVQPSERVALGILRMLNTSGNSAVEYLQKKNFSLPDSVDLLHAILPLSREKARAKLLRRLSAADADTLLNLTHGTAVPAPSYLFLYNHMIEQVLALDFIGRWDFHKAQAFAERVARQPQPQDKQILTRATPQNTKLLWSMTDKPAFYESEGYQTNRSGSTVAFSNQVTLDLATHEAFINRRDKLTGRVASVFRIDAKGDLIEIPNPKAELNLSLLVIEDPPAIPGGQPAYRSVVLGRRWAGSMAMRLYYLGGKGLKFIHRVANVDSPADRARLYLFEVDWEGFERSLERDSE